MNAYMKISAKRHFHARLFSMNLGQQIGSRNNVWRPLSTQHATTRNVWRTAFFTSTGIIGLSGMTYYLLTGYSKDQEFKSFQYYLKAFTRNMDAGWTIAQVILDYQWTLRNQPEDPSLDSRKPFDPSADLIFRPLTPEQIAYNKLKSEVHERSAKRLLQLFRRNGGIYIKLGQHLAAMEYLLPREYTETMKELQDNCPPTPLEDLKALVKSDLGIEMDELFEELHPKPLGVASLAQVHYAKMKAGLSGPSKVSSSTIPVAVKIQHPYLRDYASMDIKTCSFFVRVVKSIFPQFQFDWLADEMRKSLPQEMDFVHEARNAQKVASMFSGERDVHIPEVYLAKERVLVMEYIDGARIDDLDYIRKNNINIGKLSHKLTDMFCKMIFIHGFVHCDPHPANCFVRVHRPEPSLWNWICFWRWWNQPRFQIVLRKEGTDCIHDIFLNVDPCLVDHGLYRTLAPSFRWDYAHFWDAILRGNEADIEHYAYRLFLHDTRVSKGGVDHHRLFASMVTGRAWEAISQDNLSSGTQSGDVSSLASLTGIASGLSKSRSQKEMLTVKTKLVKSVFLEAIADILAKLPRELLLLLKTHDLLRSIESSLGLTRGYENQKIILGNLMLMMWYTAASMYSFSLKEKDNQRRGQPIGQPTIASHDEQPDVFDSEYKRDLLWWTHPSEWKRIYHVTRITLSYYILLGVLSLGIVGLHEGDDDMTSTQSLRDATVDT